MPIDIIALDDYFKLGQRVDVIKMDIQGYELHALRGASRVIADNTAIKLLVEFWPYGLRQAGVRWSDLIANLKTQGMAIWQLSNNGLVPFRAESVREVPAWYVNLFASRHSVTEYERTTKGAPDHGT